MIPIGSISFDSILWFCAGGKSFFAGLSLLVITTIIHTKSTMKSILSGIYLMYLIAVIAIILSTTPLHPVFYLFWIIVFIAWLIIRPRYKKLVFSALCAMILISLTAALIETPWHLPNTISLDNIRKIYVVGDSVSAGMGNNNEKTWPILLSEKLDRPVINLSVAGATVRTALKRQIPYVEGENNLVFLEIGGNDLLNFNSTKKYEQDLTAIINQLGRSSNKVVWFELPSLPQYYHYARIQRKLAKQYNISLIPKSVMSDVFCTKGATSDGIHLTDKGHEIMKQHIIQLVQ